MSSIHCSHFTDEATDASFVYMRDFFLFIFFSRIFKILICLVCYGSTSRVHVRAHTYYPPNAGSVRTETINLPQQLVLDNLIFGLY